jgi:hypothetical protein
VFPAVNGTANLEKVSAFGLLTRNGHECLVELQLSRKTTRAARGFPKNAKTYLSTLLRLFHIETNQQQKVPGTKGQDVSASVISILIGFGFLLQGRRRRKALRRPGLASHRRADCPCPPPRTPDPFPLRARKSG